MIGNIFFVHRGECEFRFVDFSRNCELRFRLNFHPRWYASARGSYQNFACGKFFELQKIWGKNFDFFQFSRKRWGILAFRLRRFTDIGGLYGMAGKKSGISLKLFRQRAPNVFIGVFLKVHRYFINDLDRGMVAT